MAFVFRREGPVEELGAAEELAEAPEAIETPVVLWHVARCTGVEDFVGAAEGFWGAEGFDFRLDFYMFISCHSDNVFL